MIAIAVKITAEEKATIINTDTIILPVTMDTVENNHRHPTVTRLLRKWPNDPRINGTLIKPITTTVVNPITIPDIKDGTVVTTAPPITIITPPQPEYSSIRYSFFTSPISQIQRSLIQFLLIGRI